MKLVAYDVEGWEVGALIDVRLEVGSDHCATGDDLEGHDKRVTSESYVYRLTAEGSAVTKNMVVMK